MGIHAPIPLAALHRNIWSIPSAFLLAQGLSDVPGPTQLREMVENEIRAYAPHFSNMGFLKPVDGSDTGVSTLSPC